MRRSIHRLPLALFALTLALMAPRAVAAQGLVEACYNAAGLLYIVGVEGQPDECRANDTAVSWLAQAPSNVAYAVALSQAQASDDYQTLLSTSFETTQGGTAVVHFTGEVAQAFDASGSGGVVFRIALDGQEVSIDPFRHDWENTTRDAQTVTFVWPFEVEAGSHTVEVRWRGLKATDDNFPTIDNRSLVVRHPG